MIPSISTDPIRKPEQHMRKKSTRRVQETEGSDPFSSLIKETSRHSKKTRDELYLASAEKEKRKHEETEEIVEPDTNPTNRREGGFRPCSCKHATGAAAARQDCTRRFSCHAGSRS